MDLEQFRTLEESLWSAQTRFDPDYLQRVLHRDFFEFGRSGRIWTRDDTLKSEPGPIDASLADFAVHPLGDSAVLVTYTSYVQHEHMDAGRRSSVWIRVGDSWQLRFHQGTPSPVQEGGSRRELRGGFDADAAAYDRTRPVCPAAMFDDLVQVAGLGPGDRVVEIGCGTGQATVPLALRGLAVTAVELGAALADLARTRTARFPAVSVVTGAFEDWQDTDAAPVRAVAVINALHWIDPGVRYAKPAALLAPGGALAVGACRWARPADAEPFWTEVQEDYQAVGFAGSPPPPPEQIGPWHFPAEARIHFDEVASFRYPFQWSYTAADYLAQLATQSGTKALGAERSAEFLARVRRRLDALGSPPLTATFVAQLTIGVRRRHPSAARTP